MADYVVALLLIWITTTGCVKCTYFIGNSGKLVQFICIESQGIIQLFTYLGLFYMK